MNLAVTLPSQDNFLPLSPCSQAHCEHLETQITELSAHIHAATYRLLELIREYDDSHGWAGPGLNSCAHWLNWKCGINLGAAREKVRKEHGGDRYLVHVHTDMETANGEGNRWTMIWRYCVCCSWIEALHDLFSYHFFRGR